MATSSIFHNVTINTPDQTRRFFDALKASLADQDSEPRKGAHILEDESAIRRFLSGENGP